MQLSLDRTAFTAAISSGFERWLKKTQQLKIVAYVPVF